VGGASGSGERGGASERGAGTILVVAIIGAVVTIAGIALPLSSVLVVRQRVAGAADAAALAAADVAVGRLPGVTCELAATVAHANRSSLTGCAVDGLVVTVRTAATVLGFTVTATATAGPGAP
jgi:secretion/DNA translocation related TadE-like protein